MGHGPSTRAAVGALALAALALALLRGGPATSTVPDPATPPPAAATRGAAPRRPALRETEAPPVGDAPAGGSTAAPTSVPGGLPLLRGVARGSDGAALRAVRVVFEALDEVALRSAPRAQRELLRHVDARYLGDDGARSFTRLAEVETDAGGRFELARPAGPDDRVLRLRLSGAGLLAIRSGAFFLGAAPTAVEVTLWRAARVEVTVRAPDAGPLAEPGCDLDEEGWPERRSVPSSGLSFGLDRPGHDAGAPAWAATEGGRAARTVFLEVAPGTHRAFGHAQGYVGAAAPVTVVEGGVARVDVTLAHGLTLEGRVVDDAGAPVAGAQVEAWCAGGWSATDDGHRRGHRTRAGADGAFVLRGLEPRAYHLQAEAEGLFATSNEEDPVHRPGGPPALLALVRARTIAGRVLLDADGAPAGAGVCVWATVVRAAGRQALDQEALETETGAEGTFSLSVPGPGRYALHAGAEGLMTRESVEVGVPALGEAPAAALRLAPPAPERAVPVRLLVRERRTGRPVKGAQVVARRRGHGREDRTRTDEAGEARLDLLQGAWSVAACGPDLGPVGAEVVVGAESPAPVVLELPPAGTLRLRLLDAEGAPLAGCTFDLDGVGTDARDLMSTGRTLPGTDDEGRHELKDLPAGVYAVRCHGHGPPWVVLPLGEVTLAEGETKDVVLRLGRTARLRGRALAAGRPLPGARVEVLAASGDPQDGSANAETDLDGRFEVELTAGAYVASCGAARPQTVALSPGDVAEVTLHVPAGVIAGRLVDQEGRPARGVTVLARRVDGDGGLAGEQRDVRAAWDSRSSTDGLGEFRMERLAPGRYRLLAASVGRGAALSDELQLGEGEALAGVALALGPPARLAVVMTGPDGRPAPRAGVLLHHVGLGLDDCWSDDESQADAQGGLTLDDVVPGEYVVRGWCEGATAVVAKVHVKAGATTEAALALRPTGRVVVAAALGTRVAVTPAGVRASLAYPVDRQGERRLDVEPAGVPLVVRGVGADGQELRPVTVVAPEGGVVRVELR